MYKCAFIDIEGSDSDASYIASDHSIAYHWLFNIGYSIYTHGYATLTVCVLYTATVHGYCTRLLYMVYMVYMVYMAGVFDGAARLPVAKGGTITAMVSKGINLA